MVKLIVPLFIRLKFKIPEQALLTNIILIYNKDLWGTYVAFQVFVFDNLEITYFHSFF